MSQTAEGEGVKKKEGGREGGREGGGDAENGRSEMKSNKRKK